MIPDNLTPDTYGGKIVPNPNLARLKAQQSPDNLVQSVPHYERCLIEALFVVPERMTLLDGTLEPEDFSTPLCAELYGTMLASHRTGVPPTVDIIGETNFEAVAELMRTTNYSATPALDFAFHIRAIKEASLRRKIDALGKKTAENAYRGEDVSALLIDYERQIQALKATQAPDVPEEEVRRAELLERIAGTAEADTKKIATGLATLDKRLGGGVRRGDLIVLAGRTSQGKTALATTILHDAAVKRRMCTAFYSVEMDANAIDTRLLSLATSISHSVVDDARCTAEQLVRIAEESARLNAAPLSVVPASNWTIEQIAAHAAGLHQKSPLVLIVIDHLHELRYGGKAENRTHQLREMVHEAKALAQAEPKPAVLLLAQVNRQPGTRAVKMPDIDDLREAGAIGEVADLVWFIHNPTADDETPPPLQEVQFRIAKYRNGEKCWMKLGFRGAYMQFVDLVPSSESERF